MSARLKWGLTVWSSIYPASAIRRASASATTACSLRRSSRSRPSKLSLKAFWIGLTGALSGHGWPSESATWATPVRGHGWHFRPVVIGRLRRAWRAMDMESLRMDFVTLAGQSGVTLAELCRRFGASRQAGFNWLARFGEAGEAGRPLQAAARLAIAGLCRRRTRFCPSRSFSTALSGRCSAQSFFSLPFSFLERAPPCHIGRRHASVGDLSVEDRRVADVVPAAEVGGVHAPPRAPSPCR